MIKVQWAVEEAVALFDLYFQHGSKMNLPMDEVEKLSEIYNKRAKALGLDVDEKFRNISGLKLQLACIHYVVSGGRKGMSAASKLFYNTYQLYQTNPKEYRTILTDFYSKYGDSKKLLHNQWGAGNMTCGFVKQLSKLRKLSAESVENTVSFDTFKKYLHIERPVETELRALLRQVNREKSKCLVLLCGSAGDGKSHLISYLNNADSEMLLSDFDTYNDATESAAPNLTAIDTLAEKLAPFNDDNYLIDDGTKLIIAINLGTLNNFIESDKGKKFSKLKQYVDAHEIFSSFATSIGYQADSVFQHVNFSDYQVFTLSEDGVKTDFLEKLLEKVFKKSEDNPFYRAYVESSACSMCQRCPVRHNYEFLSEPKHQKAVIHRVIEVVIKDKAIVSTREISNFLFDILVSPEFDFSSMCESTVSPTIYLQNYILSTTPMLLNEFKDISPLLNTIKQHDLLKERRENIDSEATRFNTMENISQIFSEATNRTPYQILTTLTDVFVLGGIKPELKKIVYRFIVRTKEIKGEYNTSIVHSRYQDYIKYLYYQNSGNEQKLAKLYDATKKAVLYWNGQFDDDSICIDDTNEQYWLLEQLYIKSAIYKKNSLSVDDIQRFSPVIKLRFRRNEGLELQTAEICIDFALFELICDMKDGYRPTVQDKNHHANFVSFVQQLIGFGNKSTKLTIIPKGKSDFNKITFEETDFGYEFKVV